MKTEFRLPELGENIAAAGVVAVLVREGDTIAANTPVIEIETDKATIEVPCTVGGTVSKVHVQAGEKAAVGQVVLTLEEGAARTSTPAPAPAATQPAPASAPPPAAAAAGVRPSGGDLDVKLPFLGDGITSAKVLQVFVKVGDQLEKDAPLIEIETDKTTVEVPSPSSGKVKAVHIKAGEKAEVGQNVVTLSGASSASESPAPAAAPPPAEKKASALVAAAPLAASARSKAPNGTSRAVQAPAAAAGKSAAASPTVRRLAREIGVDINTVRGSGPRGRISHEDVKAHARALLRRQPEAPRSSAGTHFVPAIELPDFSKFGEIERESMSGVRKKTAQQMATAWSTIPMVTQFDQCDITELEKLRLKLDPKARAQGAKLTVTAILLRVVASALKRFPKFNASIDLAREEVVFKKYFNVGVAVDTERGLLVPVLRNVERKNIFELSVEMQQLAEKARNRKVTPDDLQGACFTITNLGGIGGTAFTPIVNPPEVAILGVSRSSIEPVWQDGAFVPRNILPLSLSYDHRLIDGADAARFLRFLCEALENPALIVFEG